MRDLQYKTEKHDRENISKSLKVDINYSKKYKSLKKKKVIVILTGILIGSASTINSSTLAILNPNVGVPVTSSTALLTSIAILNTNENISKLKLRYSNLRDGIKVVTLLYEKTLKQSMIVKKIDEKEVLDLKQTHDRYLQKRSDITNSTLFKFEEISGDIKNKDSISPK